jgi:uncharacterized membrane protein YphA (DoxX/SURF4 family)
MKALFVLGRVIFGGFFLYNGVNHFRQTKELAQYAGAKNLPEPEAMVLLSGAAMAVGGSSIILGLKPKLGALAIMSFLGVASPLFHDFWTAQDPQQKQNEMIQFSKNLALLGAALALTGIERWPASFE